MPKATPLGFLMGTIFIPIDGKAGFVTLSAGGDQVMTIPPQQLTSQDMDAGNSEEFLKVMLSPTSRSRLVEAVKNEGEKDPSAGAFIVTLSLTLTPTGASSQLSSATATTSASAPAPPIAPSSSTKPRSPTDRQLQNLAKKKTPHVCHATRDAAFAIIERLKQEIRFLQDDLDRLVSENKYKDKEITELRKQIEESELEVSAHRAEQDALKLEFKGAQSRLEALEKVLELLADRVDSSSALASASGGLEAGTTEATTARKDNTELGDEAKPAGLDSKNDGGKEMMAGKNNPELGGEVQRGGVDSKNDGGEEMTEGEKTALQEAAQVLQSSNMGLLELAEKVIQLQLDNRRLRFEVSVLGDSLDQRGGGGAKSQAQGYMGSWGPNVRVDRSLGTIKEEEEDKKEEEEEVEDLYGADD